MTDLVFLFFFVFLSFCFDRPTTVTDRHDRPKSIHYTTLHDITRHYTTFRPTLHDITRHYTTPTRHYTTLHDITRHDTTRHDTTRHDITRHYTTLHDITRHYSTLHDITRHYTTLHDITRHYTTLHDITLHDITLHYITLPTSVRPIQYFRPDRIWFFLGFDADVDRPTDRSTQTVTDADCDSSQFASSIGRLWL